MRPHPDRPWVIAHRGAGRARRENTIEAFRLAERLGADAVELDVRRTADGSPVVHHDAVLADGTPIGALDEAELARAAPWVPSLAAALRACGRMWVNVEVKNAPADPDWDPDHQIVDVVVDLLERSGLPDRVLLSAFHPGAIGRSRELCPRIATGWLVGRGIDPIPFVEAAAEAGHRALHPAADSLTGAEAETVVEAAHRNGLLIVAWTVDRPEEIVRLAEAGVDGIITNVPGLARSVLSD